MAAKESAPAREYSVNRERFGASSRQPHVNRALCLGSIRASVNRSNNAHP